ncbi:MAG: hypothetical protein C4583_12430 [Anaerolineaceae bacterium]|nr:MAG: hypothetical protein C4583_12430 [Anaerolineaceae bacterium]
MNRNPLSSILRLTAAFLVILTLTAAAWTPNPAPQAVTANPPDHVVKLVFIHHSTGENWLTDGYGNLGQTLDANNYFVSDTNYGWGPEAIGDRTDIPNWIEWFASDMTPTYMDALFNETEQHSSYTRSLADPGGENTIIMFKSCFPNSALEGNPNDPPGTYEEFTVAGAKYVYNTILQYFAARPDKLFVVITAPPLTDSTHAKNARAFNDWLVNDWLRENNYALNNVAVFDFYNVLTDKNAHHRIVNGQIEHVSARSNTLDYPSGDDHPNERGSQKATEEFVPMLNYFYARFLETASLPPAPGAGPAPEAATPPEVPAGSAPASSVIADFESGASGWEAFRDESTSSAMTCAAEAGSGRAGNSLRIDFDIAPNSWGTCAHMYDNPQDWSAGDGLVFYFTVEQTGALFDVDLYAGAEDNRETYLFTIEAPADSATGWVRMELRWDDFHRADWEENAGEPFAKSNEVIGMAFGMTTLPDAPNVGSLRVDDVALLGDESAVVVPEPAQPIEPGASEPAEETRRRGLNCGGAAIVPLALVGFALFQNRLRKRA